MKQTTHLLVLLGVAVGFVALSSQRVSAQEGDDYAWGDGGGAAGSDVDDPMRVMAYAGAGAGFRIVRNLDFDQEFFTPAYLDLGAAVFFEGGVIRHGVGLGVSTNLSAGANNRGIEPGSQWAITPNYHLMLPFRRLLGMDYEWLSLVARLGIPLVFSAPLGGGDGVDFSLGVELGLSLVFKFLAGIGLYAEAQIGLYGGSLDTVHPIVAVDGGFVFDYELLP